MRSFMTVSTDSKESLLRRNAELAQKLALARQEILELKATVRSFRRTISIPPDSLKSLDKKDAKKISQEIDNNLSSMHKKVSPDVDEVNSSTRKKDKSSEKKKKKRSPEHDESIERLSNNSFSPENIVVDRKINNDKNDTVKKEKKRRMSYSGSSSSSQMNANNQENIFNIHEDNNSTMLNNSKSNATKRRSSMGSLSSSASNPRLSLSPSRGPLRLRDNVINYKEISLRQKMRSSFFITKK